MRKLDFPETTYSNLKKFYSIRYNFSIRRQQFLFGVNLIIFREVIIVFVNKLVILFLFFSKIVVGDPKKKDLCVTPTLTSRSARGFWQIKGKV